MRFNPATRTRILAAVTLDIDPAGSTVEVAVDGVWYPATWQGSAVVTGAQWTQTARTTDYFAGPTAVASGAIVLAATPPRHLTKTRVTKGGDVLVAESTPIDVR